MKIYQKLKFVTCIILSLVLVLSTISMPVKAAGTPNSDFIINISGVLTSYTGMGGDVVIPDGVKEIGPKAFAGCRDLTSVKMPNSVTRIDTEAFGSCYALTSVTLSKNLVSIADSAFWGCTALEGITFPSSLKEIGFGAFCNCTAMDSVYLPSKIKTIGNYAFGYSYQVNYSQNTHFVIMGTNNTAAQKYADKYTFQFVTKKNLATKLSSAKINTGKKQLTIKWKKNTSVSGYEIQYSNDKKFKSSNTKKVTIKKHTTSSKKIKLKTLNGKCYVRIRGYRLIDGKKYYSSWSKIKTVSF